MSFDDILLIVLANAVVDQRLYLGGRGSPGFRILVAANGAMQRLHAGRTLSERQKGFHQVAAERRDR